MYYLHFYFLCFYVLVFFLISLFFFFFFFFLFFFFFFFSSRRRHTRCGRDWSSDVCSSDLGSGSCPRTQAITRRSNSRPVAAGRTFHCGCASITSAPLCAGVMWHWELEIGRASCRERV